MKHSMTIVAVAAVLSLGLGSAEAGPRKPGKQVAGVINLNQATAQQLDLLPGVGAKSRGQRCSDLGARRLRVGEP